MPDDEVQRRTLSPKLIIALVVIVLLVVFWAQNRNKAKVSFLFFDGHVSVWVVLLIASVAGFIVGWLVRAGRD